MLLAWYGVSCPAPEVEDVMRGTGRSRPTIKNLATAAARLVREQLQPLTEQQIQVLTAPTEQGEDHLARTRRAQLFGVPRPRVASPAHPPVAGPFGRRQHALVDLAVRCVAALGSLTAAQLAAGIVETRRRRKDHQADTYDDLPQVLDLTPRLTHDPGTDRYALSELMPPMYRDAELVAELRRLPQVFGIQDYRLVAARLGFSDAYRVPFVAHVDAGLRRFALIDQLGPDLHHRLPRRRDPG